MRFHVVLEPGEDGWIIAACPTLPGCRSQGKTREEALENIREAITAWLEAEALDAGNESTSPTEDWAVVEVTL